MTDITDDMVVAAMAEVPGVDHDDMVRALLAALSLGKLVRLPDWDAAATERLSDENLRIAGSALGDYSFGNLATGFSVSLTVREVGRLIEAARLSAVLAAREDEPAAWLLTHKATGDTQLQKKPPADLPFNRERWLWVPLYPAEPSPERIPSGAL